jgi:hypothetical protein
MSEDEGNVIGRNYDKDSHSCWGKAREIQRRLKIWLGLDAHNIVSEMCNIWGTQNADEFYSYMRSLTDDELRAAIEEAKRKLMARKAKKKIVEYAGVA